MPGPSLRTDLVDVYLFRRRGPRPGEVEFLQMRRAAEAVLAGTWQPVIGHALAGERAAQTALRELREETGLLSQEITGFWQLEETNPYFLHAAEAVVLSPGFAVEAPADWEPVLNAEHEARRWVRRDHAGNAFLWPGQRRAIGQIVRDILAPGSAVEPILRIDPESVLRRA